MKTWVIFFLYLYMACIYNSANNNLEIIHQTEWNSILSDSFTKLSFFRCSILNNSSSEVWKLFVPKCCSTIRFSTALSHVIASSYLSNYSRNMYYLKLVKNVLKLYSQNQKASLEHKKIHLLHNFMFFNIQKNSVKKSITNSLQKFQNPTIPSIHSCVEEKKEHHQTIIRPTHESLFQPRRSHQMGFFGRTILTKKNFEFN